MLNAKKMSCITMLIDGVKQKDIAKELKVSEQTICAWKNDTEFVNEYEKRVREGIRSLVPKALKTASALLESKNDSVRYQVAKDILDRSGYKPTNEVDIKSRDISIVIGDAE